MISPIFNFVGRYNMAELYLDLAFGEEVHIPPSERFSDIGEEETLLVRELDQEPAVLTAAEVEKRHVSLL